jgi:hypothetical protein
MRRVIPALVVAALLVCVVGLQALREAYAPAPPPSEAASLLYVRSPAMLERAALSFDSLVADVYWIRAVQHYGRTKLSTDPGKRYDLLFPLLDLTTSLDPYFNIAYRFGAVFLAEMPPSGPGRPDQAIALLEKGLAAQPDRWEFAQDIGFVHYWGSRDYAQAAAWFQRAANIPGAPNWMAPLAAVTLTQGGSRDTARRLWVEVMNGAGPEEKWLRTQARFRLSQLDALDQMEALADVLRRYRDRTGVLPQSWGDLVRDGQLAGIPVDPEHFPYRWDPATRAISLDPKSTLHPLPVSEPASR